MSMSPWLHGQLVLCGTAVAAGALSALFYACYAHTAAKRKRGSAVCSDLLFLLAVGTAVLLLWFAVTEGDFDPIVIPLLWGSFFLWLRPMRSVLKTAIRRRSQRRKRSLSHDTRDKRGHGGTGGRSGVDGAFDSRRRTAVYASSRRPEKTKNGAPPGLRGSRAVALGILAVCDILLKWGQGRREKRLLRRSVKEEPETEENNR